METGITYTKRMCLHYKQTEKKVRQVRFNVTTLGKLETATPEIIQRKTFYSPKVKKLEPLETVTGHVVHERYPERKPIHLEKVNKAQTAVQESSEDNSHKVFSFARTEGRMSETSYGHGF